MAFRFSLPTPAGERACSLGAGETMFFLGANGGGKTRLAV
jgi:hypothetical protein